MNLFEVMEVAGTEDANGNHTMEQDSEVDVKTGLCFDRITAPEKHVRAKGRMADEISL